MAPRDPFDIAADLLDPPPDPYRDDPVGYCRDVLGFEPWSKQVEILESVRDHERVAVRSCHGSGKTAVAARALLWFLATRPNSRVVSTAPTWRQVEQLLWRNVRSAVAEANRRAPGTFPEPLATRLDLGTEWYAIGMSTSKPERMQGEHAPDMLVIVDEASGVEDEIFSVMEGFRTASENARMLLLGNPTRVGGQFHRAFTAERKRWKQLHISVYDTPNLSGEPVPAQIAAAMPTRAWLDDARSTYGEDSPMFQVRVLGEFAQSSENTVCSLGAVEDAQEREQLVDPVRDRVVVACDVARFGDDETVIAVRQGTRVRIRETYTGKPVTETAGRVRAIAREFPAQHVRVVVDDTGVGGGVTDILREDPDLEVTAFVAGEKAIEEHEFPNRRSELWFTMADALEWIDLDPDEQLAADLTAPQYRFDRHGRRVVESKDEMKKRLGRSPDRGDGVMLTLVPPATRPSARLAAPRPAELQPPAGDFQHEAF